MSAGTKLDRGARMRRVRPDELKKLTDTSTGNLFAACGLLNGFDPPKMIWVDSALTETPDSQPDHKPALPALTSPRSHALQLALITRCIAQSTNAPYGNSVIDLPMSAHGSLKAPAWENFIVTPKPAGGNKPWAAKRRASLRSAWGRVSADETRLALPLHRSRSRSNDKPMSLLSDRALLTGDLAPYQPPQPAPGGVPDRDRLGIPREFFTKGWIFVLRDTEILMYLMALRLSAQSQSRGGFAQISGDRRRDRFHLSSAAWESRDTLIKAGLINQRSDPNRRSDGTIIGRNNEDSRQLNVEFKIVTNGLQNDAVHTLLGLLS